MCTNEESEVRVYQVVSQELHDEGRVLVALLTKGVKFCMICVRFIWHIKWLNGVDPTSNSVIKGLLGKVACLIRRVEDLIVEDGEVEGKTKADWVCWCKVGLGNFGSILVSLEGLVGRLLSLVANRKLSKVSVVISLPGK
jgi:hypothetical protein